jgi:hypothetical protein
MDFRPEFCWYERCRARGAMVNVDGSHPRNLCSKHESGIRLALKSPGTFRVSWGRWKEEKIEAVEAVMAELDVQIESLPDIPPGWDEDWPVDETGRPQSTPKEIVQARLDWCENRLVGLNEQLRDEPIVRVNVITDDAPPDPHAPWRPPA